MISLELAKKLKEAGLQWEPKYGDYVYCVTDDTMFIVSGPPYDNIMEYLVWLPRLDQLLDEIVKRERTVLLNNLLFKFDKPDKLGWDCSFEYMEKHFYADTPEDAAGQALLWILQQRGVNS